MLEAARIQQMETEARVIGTPDPNEKELDVLKHLPGTWTNTDALRGRGWNMIALPHVSGEFKFNYRLLVNQYNEILKFTVADKGVKNRGISRKNGTYSKTQVTVALDYEQTTRQSAAADFPPTDLAGGDCLPIHHEPGLWLLQLNEAEPHNRLARLASIPHGNSVLAIGSSSESNTPPEIPKINGSPTGVHLDDKDAYLAPYFHFRDNHFKGKTSDPRYQGADPAFEGFNPLAPAELLRNAIPGTIKRTTELRVSTRFETGGIVNTPFIETQADASELSSIFWIVESVVDGVDKLYLQYLQIVTIDFFDRFFAEGNNRGDGMPGPAHWPHVSINTLEKIRGPKGEVLGPEPENECRMDDE